MTDIRIICVNNSSEGSSYDFFFSFFWASAFLLKTFQLKYNYITFPLPTPFLFPPPTSKLQLKIIYTLVLKNVYILNK